MNKSKLFVVVVIVAVCYGIIGFVMGFTYGTGESVMTLIIPAKSSTPPPAIATSTLNQVATILDTQPFKATYQSGYNCMDFAWTAMRALQWKGQQSAIVRLGFEDGSGHTVLVVPTVDKGYQFIEPQNNEIIHPMVNSIYVGKLIVNMTILEFTWKPFDIFMLDPLYGLQGWEDPK